MKQAQSPLKIILPVMAAMAMSAGAGCNRPKNQQPNKTASNNVQPAPKNVQPEPRVLEERELNRQLVEATVEIFFENVNFEKSAKGVDTLIKDYGSCTAYAYDDRTLITIRHCLGTDLKQFAVFKISALNPNQQPNQLTVKTALNSGPFTIHKLVFPTEFAAMPEVQLALDKDIQAQGKFAAKHSELKWDYPVALVFKKPHFKSMGKLGFSEQALHENQKYCFGHFVGYDSQEKWSFDSGNLIGQQTYKYTFKQGNTVSDTLSLTSLDLSFNNGQKGNSGGPIVNCNDGKVVSLEYAGANTTNILGIVKPSRNMGMFFDPVVITKLKTAIQKAEAEK